MNTLYSILDKLKISTDNIRKQYAYELIIEMFYFIDEDTKFATKLQQFISYNKELFITKIKTTSFEYIMNAFENINTKATLLSDKEVCKVIYETYATKIPQNYLILLNDDCNIENLEILLEVIANSNLKLDKTKFRNNIIKKYIDFKNVKLTINAFKTLNAYGYDITKTQLLSIKNALVEYCKDSSENVVKPLGDYKLMLEEEDFNKFILLPIFKYIQAELEVTKSVGKFVNILLVVTPSFVSNNKNLIIDIINNLSIDSQEKEEYELSIGLISLLKSIGENVEIFKQKIEEQKFNFDERLLMLYSKL